MWTLWSAYRAVALEDFEGFGSGWGTWIRTKTARVRVGSSTVKLSPKQATQLRLAGTALS